MLDGSGTVADPHGAPWGYSSTGEHRRCIPKAGGSNPPISTDVTAAVSQPMPPFNSSDPVAGPHGVPFPRSSTDEHRITDPWMQVRLLSGELSVLLAGRGEAVAGCSLVALWQPATAQHGCEAPGGAP